MKDAIILIYLKHSFEECFEYIVKTIYFNSKIRIKKWKDEIFLKVWH